MGNNRRKSRLSAASPIEENNQILALDAVRMRTQRMLRQAVNNICRLNATTQLSSLRVFKDDLEDKWNAFIHAFQDHENALSATADPTLQMITNEYAESHNQFIQAKLHVADLITKHNANQTVPNVSNVLDDTTAIPVSSQFKLPSIRITPFNGNSSDWIEFRATCESVLTDRIPEVQRLQYLKDALIGEPRETIRFVLPGPNCYTRAMQLLKSSYENHRSIVNDHLRKFYALPNLSLPTATAFRSMLNTINSMVAALNELGIDTNSWSSIIIFHLSQRFDESSLTHWEDKLEGKRSVPDLNTLLEFLRTRIATLETN